MGAKMNIQEVRQLLDPQFGYVAKSTGELLYAHHFAVWSIFKKLSKYIPSLDEKEKHLMEIACLIHDIGKMRKEIQDALRAGKKPNYPHKITSTEDVELYFEKIGWKNKFTNEDIKKITDIIRTHHGVSEKDLTEIATSSAGFYTLLLSTADHIASMERISYDTIIKLKRIYNGIIEFTTVEYSRFPSPTANLMMSKIVRHYKNYGWEPICFPENGIVFIGKPDCELPYKEEIVKEIVEGIIRESLKMQDPLPRKYTGDHLTLLSKDFPDLFLEVHKDRIKDALGNIDQKSLVFLKLLRDIMSARKIITKDLKIRKPLLDMIDGANSTSAHRLVRKRYEEIYKKPAPKKVNSEFFKPLFERALLEEVVPEEITIVIPRNKPLRELSPEELYSILMSVAKSNTSDIKKKLEEYMKATISMEEEIDFARMAEEIFEKYKKYKKTASAEKGCCERCGCPVAFKMQPALNIVRAGQAFSQIKPKYAYRSICPFCGYDNLVLREGVSSNRIRIFLRLETKIPDLFVNYSELERLVLLIWNGVRNPRNIVKFKEREDLYNLPFPERIEIPVAEEDEKLTNDRKILIGENGVLMYLEDIRDKEFSPKDMRAKYEPLYHVMKLLGFKVAIGTEEQEKLFGEEIETNEETYYKSLATILLTKLHGKEQRRYIFARTLLEKAPSVTIKLLGDMVDKKGISETLIRCLIRAMVKAKIVISKGVK